MALVTQPIALAARRKLRLLAPVEWWHLLSLDAPTVAILWAWSFARALHITLPADSLLLLFLGTWILYVADRILDGLQKTNAHRLRERHLFYIRHRVAALVAAIPVTALLVWLVFFRMLPAARRADLIIFTIAAAYFALVHLRGAKIERWFPKELIVALVFAAATAVPAWARLAPNTPSGRAIPVLVSMVVLFAALCWMNCVAIEKWETIGSRAFGQATDHITRWGQTHLLRICAVLSTLALCAAAVLLYAGLLAAAELCFAAALSASLFNALDRSGLAAFHLRIAVDAALLTPLFLLLIR